MVGIWRLTVGRGGPTRVRLEFVLSERVGVTIATLASAPKSGSELSEASGDVIFGLFFVGICEDFYRRSELDQLAEVKERREIGNAAGLLHVVSDNHDRVLRLEGLDQL